MIGVDGRAFGLMVSLRVREVPSSILRMPLYFNHLLYKIHFNIPNVLFLKPCTKKSLRGYEKTPMCSLAIVLT